MPPRTTLRPDFKLLDVFDVPLGTQFVRMANNHGIAPGAISPSAIPAEESSIRGVLMRWEGASGYADKLYFGRKNAADAYEWSVIPAFSDDVADGTVGFAAVFNVRDYGAKANGITSDHNAFQLAVVAAAHAAGGGTVYVPGRATYKLNTGLTITSSHVQIEMGPGAVLDFSGMASGATAISVIGSEATFTALTANANAGDTAISVASASGVAAGVWLRMLSDNLYDPNSTSTKCGELVRVASVSGLTVTLDTPLVDAYATADAARCAVVTMPRGVVIRGGRLLGGAGVVNNHTALKFDRCDAPLVHGVTFDRFTPHNIAFQHCVQPRAIANTLLDSVTGLGYGIAFSHTTQDGLAYGNIFRRIRHALSTNNGSEGGIVRRVIFAHNSIYDSHGIGAIDTHTAAEDIHILNNLVVGSDSIAINAEGRNTVVRGNVVIRPGANGITVGHRGIRASDHDVSDNWVFKSPDEGIQLSCPNGGAMTVCRNVVRDCGQGIKIDGESATNGSLVLNDNQVFGSLSSTGSVFVIEVNRGTVSGNVIDGGNSHGMRLRDCKDLTVTGNSIGLPSGSSASGIVLEALTAGSVSGVVVDANRCTAISPTNSTGLIIQNNAVNCTVGIANDFRGNTTEINAGTGTGHRIATRAVQTATVIASGALTIRDSFVRICIVDTEAAAATDDLDTITGGTDGQVVAFRTANNARDVTVKDATGNLRLAGDCLLSDRTDTITLAWSAELAVWLEIGRADNA